MRKKNRAAAKKKRVHRKKRTPRKPRAVKKPSRREERAAAEAKIGERYRALQSDLTERARRLFVASEAIAFGHGGIASAARATGMAPSSIGKGISEVRALEDGTATPMDPTRSRRPGGGRKKATEKDPTLLADLKALVESTTRGDPESPLLWTARSQRNIVDALEKQGHHTSMKIVSRLLKDLGYSLQANRKRLEGAQHPDRNAQFEHINETLRRQMEANEPAISVDTKKRELVGPYKNGGRELSEKGDPTDVNVHDFIDDELGRATPYGVYDLKKNEAWVSVGISHDTGEFAVQSIRTYWAEMGKARYPNASSLVITADGGGSNGYRLRLWKLELQKLVDELGFPVTVCHLPPGTSKWNKIEHRLFSFITQNWRGKPLITHQVIVNLIAATTTKSGLSVKSRIDSRVYAKGRRVSNNELALVHLEPNVFHGEWNYTIHPTGTL
jgi:Rhodopirellula transposase DDE domain